MAFVHVLVSLIFLAALGVSGVAALARFRLGLTGLELVAYGVPVGMVVWSLVALALACGLGQLSLALIIGVGIASLAVAVAITPFPVARRSRSVAAEQWARLRQRLPVPAARDRGANAARSGSSVGR